jgi:hypothetical protein
MRRNFGRASVFDAAKFLAAEIIRHRQRVNPVISIVRIHPED